MNKKIVTVILGLGLGLSSLSHAGSFAMNFEFCKEEISACLDDAVTSSDRSRCRYYYNRCMSHL